MGYKFEQFVKKVDENLICSICHEVFKDPLSCKDGHTFCRVCITKWFKKERRCPLDNSVMDNKLVRNLTVSGIIDNLDVYCHPQDTYNTEPTEIKIIEDTEVGKLKCDWTGKLHLLTKHRETCPFQQVQCPHINCKTIMQRREMEEHERVCQYKMVICDGCRQVLIRHELEKHKENSCPETLIPCPNNCTFVQGMVMKIKRTYLNDHQTNVCAKAVVDCPFKEQGCLVQVERQHVGKHKQENMDEHMMLLAKLCSQLTKQNSSLTDQCSSLTDQCALLTDQCSSLTDQCSSLTDQCSRHYSAVSSHCSLLTDRCSSLDQKCSSLDQKHFELKNELDCIKSRKRPF